MVEIDISENQADENFKVIDSKASLASKLGKEGQQIDLKLVDQLRCRIREEVEKEPEAYAPIHYEHIMDESSPATCWRYITHSDLDLEDAFVKMKTSLQWRRKNRVEELRPDNMLKTFWLHGPVGMLGKTREGHDLVYIIGKDYRKPNSDIKRIVRDYACLILFGWDTEHRHDLNKMTVVFDVQDAGFRNMDLDFMAWLISAIDYLPARFNDINAVGVPFILQPVLRLIVSWLPLRFNRIVRFGSMDDLVRSKVDDEILPVEVGGKSDSWRLAPITSRWPEEHEELGKPEVLKVINSAIGFNMSEERRAQLRNAQVEHEKRIRGAGKSL